jgi:hypothetical protein
MSIELEKRVDKLEQDIRDLKHDSSDHKTRIAVAETNIQDIKVDLGDIKNNTTWIIRLVVGAILLAMLGFYVTQGGSLK